MEAHATVLTLIGTLTGMSLQVIGEGRLSLVVAATVLTEVLALVLVYLLMVVPEEGAFDELLAAVSAQVGPGILVMAHLAVAQQTGMHEEHLPTLLTRELNSARMYVHVHINMHKILFAYWTHVFGCILMVLTVTASHVLVQHNAVGQTLIAVVALQLEAVLKLVSVQGAAVVHILAVGCQACITVFTVNGRHVSMGAEEVLLHMLSLAKPHLAHGTPAAARLVAFLVQLEGTLPLEPVITHTALL